MKHSVLLDTSFFIRLLNDEDDLHKNALGYFQYYLQNEVTLKISTISIAEYCVVGKIEDLPLLDLQIIPFNLDHAKRTGEFARCIFQANQIDIEKLSPRAIIPNDSKLFAQADLDQSITHFVTSDQRSQKSYNHLKKEMMPHFEMIFIQTPFHQTYGFLDL